MEGVLIWIAIGAYILWKVIKKNSQEKQFEETLSSIPDLTLDPKIEKIKEVNCIVVYAKGWINSKKSDSVSGKISLTLIDKTDEAAIVLTSVEGFGEKSYPHIFGNEREMDLLPDSYFPDYIKLFIVPIDVLAFPHKGHRKIEAKVLYGTHEMEVALGGLENPQTAIGAATSIFDIEVKSIGYKEFEKNALDFEESAIQLAMFTAAIDGSLDQIELDVIKSWCQKRSFFIQDEKEAEEKKNNLSKLIQRNYKQAKDQTLTMSKIMSKIKKDLSDDQRYKVVELMLDVMAADSILDEKENDLIEKTVKSLGLDYPKFKAMRDVRLSKLTTINVADGADEKLFGLDDKMSIEVKCKELRKQYSKWSGLTTSNDKVKRDQADRMVEKIAKLRQSLNC